MIERMPEDEVIKLLIAYLNKKGWSNIKSSYGQKHGCGILALKRWELVVEAKGAKTNDKSPNRKCAYFDSGQIKTHLGKALVKFFEEKSANSKSILAFAQPNDVSIRKAVGQLIPSLKVLRIKQYWVGLDGIIEE